MNGQAAEWTPNGGSVTGYVNTRRSSQTPPRARRSSSEEIKKEWEHVSHAEASGSSGRLGDNLGSVAAVSEEVIRKMFDAFQSTGSTEFSLTTAAPGAADPALNRSITIHIGERPVNIAGGSSAA